MGWQIVHPFNGKIFPIALRKQFDHVSEVHERVVNWGRREQKYLAVWLPAVRCVEQILILQYLEPSSQTPSLASTLDFESDEPHQSRLHQRLWPLVGNPEPASRTKSV